MSCEYSIQSLSFLITKSGGIKLAPKFNIVKNQNCLDFSKAILCNQCQPMVFIANCKNS